MKRIIIVIACAICVVIIAFICYMYFKKPANRDATEPEIELQDSNIENTLTYRDDVLKEEAELHKYSYDSDFVTEEYPINDNDFWGMYNMTNSIECNVALNLLGQYCVDNGLDVMDFKSDLEVHYNKKKDLYYKLFTNDDVTLRVYCGDKESGFLEEE